MKAIGKGLHIESLSSNDYFARQWYGVEIDEANTSPDLTRIASDMRCHAELPVHKLIRGCLLRDNGTVNYYLNSQDWTKKYWGGSSNLDSTDGMVVDDCPDFYYRYENPSVGKHHLKISLSPLPGFVLMDEFFPGAYKASLNRSTLALASVVNTTATYRGGDNNAAWDAANNTLLGKPATSISLTNFRTYARNRGSINWNNKSYKQHMLMYLLFMIEYATFNTQKAVNLNLTAEGYKQGGLGNGVTTVTSATWTAFNGTNPLIPCGITNSLGNGSGEISYTIPGFGDGSGAVKVPRYRGIESPFGDVWEWLDGLSVLHGAAGGVSKLYVCNTPANFADATVNNYTYVGDLPTTTGYVKTLMFDYSCLFAPKSIGGASNTYLCDYYYTPGLVNAWRALVCGGAAHDGTGAGFGFLYSYPAASDTPARIGARLAYIP
jgi:hypothetical protein